MDCSPPGSSVCGILQAWNTGDGLPSPPLGDLPNPGIEPASLMSLALAGELFITSTTWEACVYVHMLHIGEKLTDLEMDQKHNCLQMENQALSGTLF